MPPAPSFVPCVTLDLRRTRATRPSAAPRRRRRCVCAARPPRAGDEGEPDDDEGRVGRDGARDSYFRQPWDDPDSPGEDIPTEPLDEAQASAVRASLPQRVAEFVIRRAAGTGRQAQAVMARLEREDPGEVDEALEREYEDYVYESDRQVQTSLFVKEETKAEAEAKQAGYGALALFALFVLFKVAASLVAFFVKFTFSFLAIFALSAGIFMVIILFRF